MRDSSWKKSNNTRQQRSSIVLALFNRPAALFNDLSSRLLGNNDNATKDGEKEGSSTGGSSGSSSAGASASGGSNTKKRLSYTPLIERFTGLNTRHHATARDQSGTDAAGGAAAAADDDSHSHGHVSTTPAHLDSHKSNIEKRHDDHHHLHAHAQHRHHADNPIPPNLIPDISIAPTSHRENTAFHALRDTFVFPSFNPATYLPALPTIPCMSGLGQSNLFSDGGDKPSTINDGTSSGAGLLRDSSSIAAAAAAAAGTEGPQSGHGSNHFTVTVTHHHKGRKSTEENRAAATDTTMVDDPMTTIVHHSKAAGSLFSANKHDSFDKLQGLNVTMLGGYRGSILRDANTGRRLWVPLKVGFNVRKAELAIGLKEGDELKTTETVVPGKSLAAIAGFVDLGKRLKDKLKQMDREGQIHFHSWGYDWRRSLELSSAELVKQLEEAKRSTGKPTLVIAHSMGGLVALHALARAPDPTIFKGIIFGSTPFNGTPNILQPFKHGDSILMNKDICSPSTVFSFRSSFYLLPPNGACFYNADGKLHPVDFLEANEWVKYGLSPMTLRLGELSRTRQQAREDATEADAGGTAPTTVQQLGDLPSGTTSKASSGGDQGGSHEETDVSDEEIMAYLKKTLDNVRVFREELTSLYDLRKKDNYPPLVMISSTKTATVKGCLVNDEQEIIDGKYDRLLFGEGDGIILHESASALPKVWQAHAVGHIESHNGHVSILSDLNAIRQAIDLVHSSSRKS